LLFAFQTVLQTEGVIKHATQAKAWAKFPRPFGPNTDNAHESNAASTFALAMVWY